MKRKDCCSPISFALDSSICRIGAERLDASDVFLVLLCDSGGFRASSLAGSLHKSLRTKPENDFCTRWDFYFQSCFAAACFAPLEYSCADNQSGSAEFERVCMLEKITFRPIILNECLLSSWEKAAGYCLSPSAEYFMTRRTVRARRRILTLEGNFASN
jgi:hypothetical protein